MKRIRASITLTLSLSLVLACSAPTPSSPLPATSSTRPTPTIPVTASTGPSLPAPTTSIGSNEIRNHLLSTLDFVAEVSGDLANANDGPAVAKALAPLVGVLNDEVTWLASHVPAGVGGPIDAYGRDVATARAAIAAVEGAGAAVSDQLVASARAAVTSLLDLRPSLEALPTETD